MINKIVAAIGFIGSIIFFSYKKGRKDSRSSQYKFLFNSLKEREDAKKERDNDNIDTVTKRLLKDVNNK